MVLKCTLQNHCFQLEFGLVLLQERDDSLCPFLCGVWQNVRLSGTLGSEQIVLADLEWPCLNPLSFQSNVRMNAYYWFFMPREIEFQV